MQIAKIQVSVCKIKITSGFKLTALSGPHFLFLVHFFHIIS